MNATTLSLMSSVNPMPASSSSYSPPIINTLQPPLNDVDDLTLATATNLSLDELDDEINQSTELQCLMQEHMDAMTFGNDSDYCLTQFDSILCWPRTPRATLAILPCLDEFQGIQYDSSRKYHIRIFIIWQHPILL